MPGSGYENQQLVELLTVVTSCEDRDTATRAAVECAAGALEAEFAAVVVDGRVVASVGFGGSAPDVMATVAPGRAATLDVLGTGKCAAGAARFGDEGTGRLVIARLDLDFTVEEYNLIRGMAKVLGLTLRMLDTLEQERRRRRLMNHLYAVQRALSRRVPLSDVVSLVVDGTRDVLGNGTDTVTVWLGATLTPAAFSGVPAEPATLKPFPTLVAPVHEDGHVAGRLEISRREGAFGPNDEEDLLAFAEHVSLAVTSAKHLHDIHQAMHDSLTGLASRQLFLRDLDDVLADPIGEPVALLFIDLDRFKQVNDTLGHIAGDLVLATAARRIGTVLHPGDLAARLGGDEFAVLLRNADPTDATEVADRLIDTLNEPITTPEGQAEIGASVGIATTTTGTGDPSPHDLLRRADVAMYEAKRSGRNHTVLFADHIFR